MRQRNKNHRSEVLRPLQEGRASNTVAESTLWMPIIDYVLI